MNFNNWHVGMKVVCIDDRCYPVDPKYQDLYAKWPLRLNKIYTIRSIGICRDETIGPNGEIVKNNVMIEIEVPNPFEGIKGFDARRFRPLQKRKTDISVFTQMLNDVKIRENV